MQEWITHSLGDSGYGRAIEGLRVMREELGELEEAGLWNELVRELKGKVLKGEVGGDRRERWWLIRVSRVGLLDKKAGGVNGVDEEEAKRFLSAS